VVFTAGLAGALFVVAGALALAGADWVARYFVVTENCARATQLKLEQLRN